MSFPMMPEQSQTDHIQAVKPRRTRQSAKKAGASFERQVADYLATVLCDDRIDRRVKTGAKDRGDIAGVRTIRGARVVIEAKNYGGRLVAPTWLAEAAAEAANDDAAYGIVVAKRRGTTDPRRQYVLMDLETLAALIEGGPDNLRGV